MIVWTVVHMINIADHTFDDEVEKAPPRELFHEIEEIQQYELQEFPQIRLCFRILGHQKKNINKKNFVIIEYFVLGQGSHEVDSDDVAIGDKAALILAQEKMPYIKLLGDTHVEYKRMPYADREQYVQSLLSQ